MQVCYRCCYKWAIVKLDGLCVGAKILIQYIPFSKRLARNEYFKGTSYFPNQNVASWLDAAASLTL